MRIAVLAAVSVVADLIVAGAKFQSLAASVQKLWLLILSLNVSLKILVG